ncbi:MAG: EMC3/TMCO1 family protein [Nanoarchaeota archaeon]|nr:EMC3/TMCO1 family protein [Nanoarchaeota archaeon]
MDDEGKQGSFRGIVIVMIISLFIAYFWNSVSWIKDFAHSILDPTVGALLAWDLTGGMILVVLVMALITTLTQKYGTDQETIREMKKEQKELQKEIKEVKEHPEKLMALQKKQLEFLPKMMKLSMRPVVYTAIPFILLFRWFADFFAVSEGIKILGLSWLWFYILGSIIFGMILRKIFKVV